MPDQKCILELKGIEIQFPGVKALEEGETFDKTVIHPEEGVFDCVGGIDCGTVVSTLAADVIDERVY